MSIDVTIGERTSKLVPPLVTCPGCKPWSCDCRVHQVRQEERKQAPQVATMTPGGLKKGSFNFQTESTGYFYRFLEQTGLMKAFDQLGINAAIDAEYPCTIAIPPGLAPAIKQAINALEEGEIHTESQDGDRMTRADLDYARWWLWWLTFATATYGERAAIEFR